VLADVRLGLVGEAAARDIYGTVVNVDTDRVDDEAVRRHRTGWGAWNMETALHPYSFAEQPAHRPKRSKQP
jgi:hypothetical protein